MLYSKDQFPRGVSSGVVETAQDSTIANTFPALLAQDPDSLQRVYPPRSQKRMSRCKWILNSFLVGAGPIVESRSAHRRHIISSLLNPFETLSFYFSGALFIFLFFLCIHIFETCITIMINSCSSTQTLFR